MNEQQLASIERKNAWLHDLVEVEFPTPESLKGRETYFQAINAQEYQIVAKNSLLEGEANLQADDIFPRGFSSIDYYVFDSSVSTLGRTV